MTLKIRYPRYFHKPDSLDHYPTMTGKETACPKCGLKFNTLLHPFCTHKVCPPNKRG